MYMCPDKLIKLEMNKAPGIDLVASRMLSEISEEISDIVAELYFGWPDHPRLSSTSCSESWTLQRESWAAHGSTTAVWHSSFTLSCTGSMWQIGSCTSSAGWYTSVFTAKRLTTCLSCACSRSSRWTTASPFSQPQLARRRKVPAEHVWPSCLCRGCARNLELTVGWTAKSGSPQCHLPMQLKDVSVSIISGALRALEALCDYALYKSTFTLHYISSWLNFGSPAPREGGLRWGKIFWLRVTMASAHCLLLSKSFFSFDLNLRCRVSAWLLKDWNLAL